MLFSEDWEFEPLLLWEKLEGRAAEQQAERVPRSHTGHAWYTVSKTDREGLKRWFGG